MIEKFRSFLQNAFALAAIVALSPLLVWLVVIIWIFPNRPMTREEWESS